MRPGRTGAPLIKHLLDLRGYFQRKGVEPLREIPNILQKLIVEDNRRNRRSKARRGGHEGLRDARRHRAKAGGSGAAKTCERIDNPPHSSKETDEWRYRPVVASQDMPFSTRRTSSAEASCMLTVTACKLFSLGGCGLLETPPTWLCSSR